MMKRLLAVLFVFVAASSFALDIITREGKSFFDCTVKGVERDGLRVTHRDGTGFVDFDALPSAIQKQYGWTEQKSAERKAARAAALEQQKLAETEALKMRQAEAEAARAAQEAAAKAKAEEAHMMARNEERVKQWAADQRALELANEKRIQAETQERKKAEENMRAVKRYSVLSGLTLLYFLPAFIGRRKRNCVAIFVLNLMGFVAWAGWVIYGFLGFALKPGMLSGFIFACGAFLLPFAVVVWITGVIWSLTTDAQSQTVVQTVIMQPPPQPHAGPRPVAAPRPVAKAIPPSPRPPLPPTGLSS